MTEVRVPWQVFGSADGVEVARPVVDVFFPALGRAETMLLDSGADISLAPKKLADEMGLDWEAGKSRRYRGISPKPECAVAARVLEIEVELASFRGRFVVPFAFADAGDVPLLAGRRGFFERFRLCLDGSARESRIASSAR